MRGGAGRSFAREAVDEERLADPDAAGQEHAALEDFVEIRHFVAPSAAQVLGGGARHLLGGDLAAGFFQMDRVRVLDDRAILENGDARIVQHAAIDARDARDVLILVGDERRPIEARPLDAPAEAARVFFGMGAIYEKDYLLGTSTARPLIARAQVEEPSGHADVGDRQVRPPEDAGPLRQSVQAEPPRR